MECLVIDLTLSMLLHSVPQIEEIFLEIFVNRLIDSDNKNLFMQFSFI